MDLFTQDWADYALLDSGGAEKLERFGPYVLARPEPQALWPKRLTEAEWRNTAHARFHRQATGRSNKDDAGAWEIYRPMPERWSIRYQDAERPELDLSFRLARTAFKHLGLFPEQRAHWTFIFDRVKALKGEKRVLNLFAYTGASSLAAKAAGADLTHLDSVKPVVHWAKENMEASKLRDIRWLIEDALTFVKREQRRGRSYQGLILDPPAYGRGPKGEKWLLETQLPELLEACGALLQDNNAFLVFNLYSLGFSPWIMEGLVRSYFKTNQTLELGELLQRDQGGRVLPLGSFLRF